MEGKVSFKSFTIRQIEENQKTYTPEKTTTTNITDILVVTQTLLEKFPQLLSPLPDVLEQVFLSDDALYLIRGGTRDGMALVGLTVDEAARAVGDDVDDILTDQQRTNRGVACAQTLGNSL